MSKRTGGVQRECNTKRRLKPSKRSNVSLTPSVSPTLNIIDDEREIPFKNLSPLTKYNRCRHFATDMKIVFESMGPTHILQIITMGEELNLQPTGEEFLQALELFTDCVSEVRRQHWGEDYGTQPLTPPQEETPNEWLEATQKYSKTRHYSKCHLI